MKRIIRLTESDLTRIVRRVIRENEGDVATEIMECSTEVLGVENLEQLPTCQEFAMKVMVEKKIPTDMGSVKKMLACGRELVNLQKKPDDVMELMNCVLGKIGNTTPVMNTNESRRRSLISRRY